MIATSLSSSRISAPLFTSVSRFSVSRFSASQILGRAALLGIGAVLALGMVTATTNLSLATFSFGMLPESALSHLNELLSGDLLLGLQATVLLLTLSHLIGDISPIGEGSPRTGACWKNLSLQNLSLQNFPQIAPSPLGRPRADLHKTFNLYRQEPNGGRMSYQTANSIGKPHTPSGFSARSPFFVIPKRSLSCQRPGEKLTQQSWMARITERCSFGCRTSSTETLSARAC